MELRHLRYFIAVAEAGSLTVAAEKKLHTAQPSLGRRLLRCGISTPPCRLGVKTRIRLLRSHVSFRRLRK
jgi:Bacterial regulatory helix-turn-helix protein, lysR family